MASSKRSEDIYGEKIDRCLYNSMVKFVGGVGIGMVFSAILFKRKMWPVLLGGGVGSGMAISDCNHEFSSGPGISRTSYSLEDKLGTVPSNLYQDPKERHDSSKSFSSQRKSKFVASKKDSNTPGAIKGHSGHAESETTKSQKSPYYKRP